MKASMPVELIDALDKLALKRGLRPAHEILEERRKRRYWWVEEGAS